MSAIKLVNGPCNGLEMIRGSNLFQYTSVKEDLVGKIRFGTEEITMMVRLPSKSSEYYLYKFVSKDEFVYVGDKKTESIS